MTSDRRAGPSNRRSYVTTPDMLLLNNAFDPITRSIAFFNAPLRAVADELLAWRREHSDATRHDYGYGLLSEMLRTLEPLRFGGGARELLVSTANKDWVAYFEGSMTGADSSPVGHLAQRLECRALRVESTVPAPPGDNRHRNGATQFLLIADHRTEWLNHERAVGVGQDGAHWRFGQAGAVQDFETPEAYDRRGVRERFTHAMLVDYCAALGLHPFDVLFYRPPAVLITNNRSAPATNEFTLAQARQHFGLEPEPAPDRERR